MNWNGSSVTVVAGALEQAGDVVDAVGVARCVPAARVPPFAVGDRLERRLVLADALERHAPQQLVVGVVGAVCTAWRRRSGGSGQHERHEHRGDRREERDGRDAHASFSHGFPSSSGS